MKCTFFERKNNFLGHLVSEQGISTNPEKIIKIVDCPISRNKKQVKSFVSYDCVKIGAVLSQIQYGIEREFGCSRRVLDKPQTNYYIKLRKVLATEESESHFEFNLLGSYCKGRSFCSKWLLSFKNLDG